MFQRCPLLSGRSAGLARRRASDLLDQVGLADRARHLPSQLSGTARRPSAEVLAAEAV